MREHSYLLEIRIKQTLLEQQTLLQQTLKFQVQQLLLISHLVLIGVNQRLHQLSNLVHNTKKAT